MRFTIIIVQFHTRLHRALYTVHHFNYVIIYLINNRLNEVNVSHKIRFIFGCLLIYYSRLYCDYYNYSARISIFILYFFLLSPLAYAYLDYTKGSFSH